MRARLFICAAVLVLTATTLAATGCSHAADETAAAAPSEVLVSATAPAGDELATIPGWLTDGIGTLGFDLLSQMRDPAHEANTLLSPLALHSSLALASMGASGTAAAELDTALGLEGHSPEAVGAAYADLLAYVAWIPDGYARLSQSRVSTISVATCLWADTGTDVDTSFLAKARRYFGAEVRAIDLQAPGTPVAIGQWVAEQSGGMFPNGSRARSENTGLALSSTLLFQHRWERAFPAENTSEGVFTTGSGRRATVSFMGDRTLYNYAENDRAQLIAVPYMTSKLWVLLPREGVSMDDLLAEYDLPRWKRMRDVALTTRVPGTLALPRIETRSTNGDRLRGALEALGLSSVFEPGAFPGITEGADLDSLSHEVVLSVDESGTTAGAYTDLRWGVGSCDSVPPTPFTMRADRPFLILLEDGERGPLLFIGEVNDPGTAE